MCTLAPLALAATMAVAPMCPRADGPGMAPVMAALVGDARVELASNDLQFEAQIRAIHAPAPSPRKRRHRR